MTALPLIETQEGDVSAYIPTNVISITDGQIYLQSNLFFQGQRPAVDTGLSVSRVGGAAQRASMKQVAGTLRLDLASYREMQAFAQFGSDLDAATQHQLTHGSRMTEVLKQGRFSAIDVADQAIVLYAGKEGFLDVLPIEQVLPFRTALIQRLAETRYKDLRASVRAGKIGGETEEQIRALVKEVQAKFLPAADVDVDAGALQAAAATANSSDAKIAARVSEQSATTEADATTPRS
jgi:F-type H+-transporting ATPase subunit alpha